ncbi:MAG: Ig-like domain-containing protein [Candidatus Micrarchaeia archaeon]
MNNKVFYAIVFVAFAVVFFAAAQVVKAGYECDASAGGKCCPPTGSTECPRACSLSGVSCYEDKASSPQTIQLDGKSLSCERIVEVPCDLFSFGSPALPEDCKATGEQPFCIPIISSLLLGGKGACTYSNNTVCGDPATLRCPAGMKKVKETACKYSTQVFPQCCDLPAQKEKDLCAGVSCADKCDGTTRLSGGSCNSLTGECEYAKSTEKSSECGYVAPPKIMQINVDPPFAAVSVGDSQQFSFTALDDHGEALGGVKVRWETTNESVATISSDGLLTASNKAGGSAFVRAIYGPEGTNLMEGTAQVVVITLKELRLSPSGSIKVKTGTAVPFVARAVDVEGKDYAVSKLLWAVNASFNYKQDSNSGGTTTVITPASEGTGKVQVSYAFADPLTKKEVPIKTTSTDVEAISGGGDPVSLSILPSEADLPPMITAGRAPIKFYALAFDADGVIVPAEVQWSSSNSSVASVSADGLFTPLEYGEVTITASLKDNPSVSAQLTISVGKCVTGSTRLAPTQLNGLFDNNLYDAEQKCSNGKWGEPYLKDRCAGAAKCGADIVCSDAAKCGPDFNNLLHCCPAGCSELNDDDCKCDPATQKNVICTDKNGLIGTKSCDPSMKLFGACGADPLFAGGNTGLFNVKFCIVWGDKTNEYLNASTAISTECSQSAIVIQPRRERECSSSKTLSIALYDPTSTKNYSDCKKLSDFASYTSTYPINCFESKNYRYVLRSISQDGSRVFLNGTPLQGSTALEQPYIPILQGQITLIDVGLNASLDGKADASKGIAKINFSYKRFWEQGCEID